MNFDKKLVRFGDLYYLSSEGTPSQYGDNEKKELEILGTEISDDIKIADAFRNSKFGVYNNDFVNDLRKAEKRINKIKELFNGELSVDYNGFQDLVKEALTE